MFSGYELYLTVAVFIISNIIYRKMVKDLKYELDFDSNFDSEIWEMVKEEAKKGNFKARVACVAYWVNSSCLIAVVVIACLANIANDLN